LQRSDRAVLEHGIETGVIKRLPHGEYIEVHQLLGPADSHGHPISLEYQGAPVPKKMAKLGSAGKPGTGSFLRPDPSEEAVTIAQIHHDAEKSQLGVLREYQAKGLAQSDEEEIAGTHES
ncbi:cytochrome b, partial [Nocardia sp. NPDC059236]